MYILIYIYIYPYKYATSPVPLSLSFFAKKSLSQLGSFAQEFCKNIVVSLKKSTPSLLI